MYEDQDIRWLLLLCLWGASSGWGPCSSFGTNGTWYDWANTGGMLVKSSQDNLWNSFQIIKYIIKKIGNCKHIHTKYIIESVNLTGILTKLNTDIKLI